MKTKNLLILFVFILALVSSCCKKKACTNVEITFLKPESDWVDFNSTGAVKDSNGTIKVFFSDKQNKVDSFFVFSTLYGPGKVMCESPCCKTCTEDLNISGELMYSEITKGSYETALVNFNLDITKGKTGFKKNIKANSYELSNFDTIYTNVTVHNKTYDSVYVKTLDTSAYNPIYKIWFSKRNGLLKYQLTQNRTWELM